MEENAKLQAVLSEALDKIEDVQMKFKLSQRQVQCLEPLVFHLKAFFETESAFRADQHARALHRVQRDASARDVEVSSMRIVDLESQKSALVLKLRLDVANQETDRLKRTNALLLKQLSQTEARSANRVAELKHMMLEQDERLASVIQDAKIAEENHHNELNGK